MPDFVYDTNTLIKVVPNLKRAQKFLLDNFFPGVADPDSEFVSIDVDVGKRRMAPFVSPLVEGKLVEQRRLQTNTFKPAYIKDKRAPDLRKPVRRMIGERIGGALTGAEREMANLEFEMTDQVDMLDRRLEWMAAQTLLNGTLTVAGEGFPTTLIDFGRDPALTIALSGSAMWGVSGNLDPAGHDTMPARNIEAWQYLVLKKSGGLITDLIFTVTPFQLFLNDQKVFASFQFPKLGANGNELNPGAQIARGAIYKGTWGNYRCWVYNDWYVDDNNVEQPMLPDGTVIGCGSDLLGIRAYGQIMDPNFNYRAMPYAPKTWVREDPAQRLIMMQSSPLTIPSRVNACFSASVCAPVLS